MKLMTVDLSVEGDAMNRKFVLIAAGIGVAGLLVAMPWWSYPAYQIEPGAVLPGRGERSLNGEFHVRERTVLPFITKPLDPATESNSPVGGACLVVDPRDVGAEMPDPIDIAGVSCTSDSDCTPLNKPGASGYCEIPAGVCWIRPGPAAKFCRRSIDPEEPDEWPVGTHKVARANLTTLSQQPVTWRVVTAQRLQTRMLHRMGTRKDVKIIE